MKRRDFLYLGGAGILAGCGGVSLLEPDLSGGSLPRTTPTGSLRDQIQQYSLAVDSLSTAFATPSSDIAELVSQQAGRSRAVGDEGALLRETFLTLRAGQAALDRTFTALLRSDDLAHLGDAVTAGNRLAGASRVDNPQWNAAILGHFFHSAQSLGLALSLAQSAGLASFRRFIQSAPTTEQKSVAYAVFAERFNLWGDRLAQATGGVFIAADRLPTNASGVALDSLLADLPGRVGRLPFGPHVTSPSACAFLTTLIEPFVDTQNSGELATWLRAPNFDVLRSPFTPEMASIIRQVVATAAVEALACTRALSSTMYLLLRVAASTVPNPSNVVVSVFGSITDSLQANLAALTTCLNTLEKAPEVGRSRSRKVRCDLRFPNYQQCGLDDNIAELECDIRNGRDRCGQIPSGDGNFPPSGTIEHDQLATAGLSISRLTVPTGGMLVFTRKRAVGDAASLRAFLQGDRAALALPRTFDTLSRATATLIHEYFQRNATNLNPRVEGDDLVFTRSSFSLLLRREANSNVAVIPQITEAQLLCSGPGFIPMRSTSPKNLTQMSLPALMPLSELGNGVNFDVQ